jgi:hypothetical protein
MVVLSPLVQCYIKGGAHRGIGTNVYSAYSAPTTLIDPLLKVMHWGAGAIHNVHTVVAFAPTERRHHAFFIYCSR